MDKPKVTPRDFFLWAGSMVSLFWSTIAFISLVFTYIDLAFKDTLHLYPVNPYDSGMGFQMASLIVMVPAFLALMFAIRRSIETDPTRADLWVRRWALYLVLFAAGAAIAGDIIALLNTFFSGNALTIAFVLKIAIVLMVAAVAFMHFIADVWGYWEHFPKRARTIGYMLLGLVIVTVSSGFVIAGTPHQARLARFDHQKISDLSSIGFAVQSFYTETGSLPRTLNDVQNPLRGFSVPVDPQSGAPYEYRVLSAKAFSLCAEFNTIGSGNSFEQPQAQSIDWVHTAGRNCFERTVYEQKNIVPTEKVPPVAPTPVKK